MKGLYFYKLVSPYQEDVTKDCKLTVNEIDHNFVTLKDADIKNVAFDKETNTISLIRNNKEELQLDLSPMVEGITTDLTIDYDSVEGKIMIAFNGEHMVINGLVTEDNLSDAVLTEVISDGTLRGLGSKRVPLGIAAVEKTGAYRPAIKLIDRTKNEMMPSPNSLKLGDRFVTRETVSDYGYLYNYKGVRLIDADLKNGWRVPTKEDWDNILNAIEPCDEYRTHGSSTANNMLGKYAGKLLKSRDFWTKISCASQTSSCVRELSCECDTYDKVSDDNCLVGGDDDALDFEPIKPNQKPQNPQGVDAYGMGLMPAGFSDGCELVDYFGKRGSYWTNTSIAETDIYVKRFDYDKSGVIQHVECPRNFFSLRLVKDYDGSNYQQVEFINGMNYSAVLMPSLNTPHGFSIWTSTNIAFPNKKYEPIEPNRGQNLSSRIAYYINEWNGFDWERKEMKEGESIVLLKGLNNDTNMDYRIIDGKLVSVAKNIFDQVHDETQVDLDEIKAIIGEGVKDENNDFVDFTSMLGSGLTDSEGERLDMTSKINELDAFTTEINGNLNQEIDDRLAADEELRNDLEKETEERQTADEALRNDLEELGTRFASYAEDETIARIEEDEKIKAGLQYEITSRKEADEVLDGKIEDETKAREEAIEKLKTVDAEIKEALDAETDSRKKTDEAIRESVGLTDDFSYVPSTDSTLLSASTTVSESIELLDEKLAKLGESSDALQGELDKTQESIGLEEDGTLPSLEGSNYIATSKSIVDALGELDNALRVESDRASNKETELDNNLISDNQDDNAFDCANGVLTLKRKGEDVAPIEIKLDGNYGVFPSPQV